jgi:hypothetical protein
MAARVLLFAGRYGAFRMHTIVDQAKVQVTYHHGVLALRLPKHAATIPQGIAIIG